MRLYQPDCKYITAENIEQGVDTPLGSVFSTIQFCGEVLIGNYAESTSFLEYGGHITAFQNSNLKAELLICRPQVQLPKGLSVEDCWAFLWRVKAKGNINALRFLVQWNGNKSWNDSDSESGEYLEAISFCDDKSKVMIGTQDGVALVSRGMMDDFIPKFDQEVDSYSIVRYLKNGLEVPIPSLDENEICQIQFVIAWNNYSKDEVGTWYAVDLVPQSILEGAHVK